MSFEHWNLVKKYHLIIKLDLTFFGFVASKNKKRRTYNKLLAAAIAAKRVWQLTRQHNYVVWQQLVALHCILLAALDMHKANTFSATVIIPSAVGPRKATWSACFLSFAFMAAFNNI